MLSIDNLRCLKVKFENDFNFNSDKKYNIISKLDSLKSENKIAEYIIISTCQRFEVYFMSNLDNNEIKKSLNFDILIGYDAAKYLFKVTSGLESSIICEDQILSQVKKAYLNSINQFKFDSIINKVFNLAISTGKNYRTSIKNKCLPLSLESIVVNFISKKFECKTIKILLIGVGEINNSIIYLLKRKDYTNLSVTNRTHRKTENLSKKYNIKSIEFKNRYDEINDSDLIISATSAPHSIIKYEKLKKKKYSTKKIFIDLSNPEDIEKEVENISNFKLFDLKYILSIYNENIEKRNNICLSYCSLIDENIEKLYKWYEFRRKL